MVNYHLEISNQKPPESYTLAIKLTNTFNSIYVCVYVCVYMCIYVCVCIYIHMCVCVYIYIYICVCVCVCVCVCIYLFRARCFNRFENHHIHGYLYGSDVSEPRHRGDQITRVVLDLPPGTPRYKPLYGLFTPANCGFVLRSPLDRKISWKERVGSRRIW